jgi:Cys-tRNA(Pro)/Cys-tRNA(Cys) deacylase
MCGIGPLSGRRPPATLSDTGSVCPDDHGPGDDLVAQKTNAVRLVEQAKVAHEVRAYDISMDEFNAAAVADLIGLPAAQVFKTLVASGASGACFAVVPADAELDLKALARVADERKMAMLAVKDVEPLTGYRRGGVTALGSRKRLPVYLDASAQDHEIIGVSAGTKGLQLLLSPTDYLTLTDAVVAPIAMR